VIGVWVYMTTHPNKMKKIASFTQTYRSSSEYSWGTDCKDRTYLLDWLVKDENANYLRNNLDLHVYSFHNCDVSYAKDQIKKLKATFPDIKGVCYNNMTFGRSVCEHLMYLKSQGVTDVLWINDDEFSVHNNIQDYKDFLNFYRSRPDINHVYLRNDIKTLVDKIQNTADDVGEQINENLRIFKTTCHDYVRFDNHALPSGGLICDIEILLQCAFANPVFLTTMDAYMIDSLMGVVAQKLNFQRCTLNITLLQAFNITGMGGSIGNGQQYLDELNQRFNTSVLMP
jgi:hypothetical protein